MSHARIPPAPEARLNSVLAGVFGLLAVFQAVLLPAGLLPRDAAWGWLLVPLVLASNSYWAFIHEAIHGAMFAGKDANRRTGRALSIGFGAAFDLLRAGHLLHHAYSRTPRERSEVFAGARPSRAFVAAYYLRLGGGLYLGEVAGSLLLLLPRPLIAVAGKRLAREDNVIEALLGRLASPPTLAAARVDAVAILVLHGCALALYGEHAWMYLLALAGRGVAVSLVDNVFHYGTALDAPRQASNLRLPALVSALILNFNLHGAHHLRPGLPWWKLRGYHAAAGLGYQDDWWPALLRQWRGPLSEDGLLRRDAARA